MEKISKYIFGNVVRSVCIFSFALQASVTAETPISDCCIYEDCFDDEALDFEGIEELEELFREFEAQADEEFALEAKGFFVKKWCKKLKRWFQKTTVKLLKKLCGFKKFKSGDHCAYEIARFKRKIDSRLHNTGDIENMLGEFRDVTNDPAYRELEIFRDRIRYYYNVKNAKPPKHPDHDRYNFSVACDSETKKKNDLDRIPARALFGGVEVACGFLIQAIPLPGCLWLGRGLIGHGMSEIYEGYMKDHEKKQKELAHG